MIDFLKKVYSSQCENGDYIILSAKNIKTGKWLDVPILYKKKTIVKELDKFFKKYPKKENDLYFSPMAYSEPKRQKKYGKETKFLAQDIDETPITSIDVQPTYYWYSSPKKTVGLWEIDRYIKEDHYTPLNKRLAKEIQADDCYDFTHVYRIPETTNHKYKNKPKVTKPVDTKKLYRLKNLEKAAGYSKVNKERASSVEFDDIDIDDRDLFLKYNIPKKVMELLALDDAEGLDRSDTIWFIENALINDVGMQPNEVIHLIKGSAFNKYAGRDDEDERLHTELNKIMSNKFSKTRKKRKSPKKRFKTVTFDEMQARGDSFQGWLIKGFWGKKSNGIVAGMPKSYKSTLTLDMAISVATGRPFLGHYPVEETGNVLIIQNENAESILNDRSFKMVKAKGLAGSIKEKKNGHFSVKFPEALPITFINNQGFNLNDEEDREAFEDYLKTYSPKLVILDPFYLMFTGDMNSAQDLNPILNWLNIVKERYGCSIILIHHYNKGTNTNSSRGGQRMAGSIFLYGWLESAWYVTKADDPSEDGTVDIQLTREFRFAGGFQDLDIQLVMGEDEFDDSYNVIVTENGFNVREDALCDSIISLLKRHPDSLCTVRYIQEELALTENATRKLLKRLVKSDDIISESGGYRIK